MGAETETQGTTRPTGVTPTPQSEEDGYTFLITLCHNSSCPTFDLHQPLESEPSPTAFTLPSQDAPPVPATDETVSDWWSLDERSNNSKAPERLPKGPNLFG